MNGHTWSGGIIVGILALFSASLTLHAEPLRLRYAVWSGFGPLFVAQEKGLFAEEGVEVELIEMEDHTAAFAGLAAGQIDAILGSAPDAPTFSQPGDEPLGCALIFDESFGGDGVLAQTGIRSISDLEGKSIAFLRGSVSQFYLNVLLNEAGLSEADVEVVDLTGEDAVSALMLEEVDATVTWEPWLSQGNAAENVQLLTDSSEQPGLIIDCLITTARALDDRRAEFQALARAWFAGLDYFEAHRDEAIEIMARNIGGGLEGADFAKTLEVVRFYNREENKAQFGTPENPGSIYETAQKVIDVLSNLDTLKFHLSPSDIVIHGILDE